MSQRMLSKTEVAAEFGVSTRTINRWMAKKAIRAFRRGGVVRFDPAEVKKFKDRSLA